MAKSPSAFNGVMQAPVVDQAGNMTYGFLKLLQDWNTRLTNGLDLLGAFIGNIGASATIGMRTEGIGTTVQNIDSAGVITSAGVDFQRSYAHKDLDHIADTASFARTSPNQVTGAGTAYAALVSSTPSTGQFLKFSGGSWAPTVPTFSDITGTASSAQIPAPTPVSLGGVQSITAPPNQWINGINSSGIAQVAQPAFSNLAGTVTASQLPAGVPVVSFGVGVPVAASTEGYLYFDTTGTPYHGYVFHSGAWVQFS